MHLCIVMAKNHRKNAHPRQVVIRLSEEDYMKLKDLASSARPPVSLSAMGRQLLQDRFSEIDAEEFLNNPLHLIPQNDKKI